MKTVHITVTFSVQVEDKVAKDIKKYNGKDYYTSFTNGMQLMKGDFPVDIVKDCHVTERIEVTDFQF